MSAIWLPYYDLTKNSGYSQVPLCRSERYLCLPTVFDNNKDTKKYLTLCLSGFIGTHGYNSNEIKEISSDTHLEMEENLCFLIAYWMQQIKLPSDVVPLVVHDPALNGQKIINGIQNLLPQFVQIDALSAPTMGTILLSENSNVGQVARKIFKNSVLKEI